MAQLHSLDHAGLIHLPVGLWMEGMPQREAVLQDLRGRDEERIADASRWPSTAARVSALLTATLRGIGQIAPVDLEHVRALAVLDRDILLVALRRRLFGDRIVSTIRCPEENCGKLVDIEFKLGDLQLPERTESRPAYACQIGGRQVTLRLPNGADQESVAARARVDPEQASRLILGRCVDHFDDLASSQVEQLVIEMARLDPQLDTEFAARCPECGQDFTVHFDIQDFLLREISAAGDHLYRQVHTLAWYYHWGEAEIMAMPTQKRRLYIKMLSDMVSEAEQVIA
ncbi:MAG TPA: hypothetical protein VLZ89_13355 [Anaerolineales bacterium]|nr:hypothetical protein [Anaerolineales bacterium]